MNRKRKNNGSEEKAGNKKIRTTFTVQQISELENNFVSKKYLTSAERAELATDLGVTQQQVGRDDDNILPNIIFHF